ncbi:MAG: TonB-dependent receptor [Myxococcota bacterium]|nr:TonB-dependent receptor [Myxococcota bacterium]
MQTRGRLLTGFLVAWTAGAGPAWSQQGSGAPDSAEAAAYTPGIEERVVLAGESEGARDFEAGDSVQGFDASDLEALGAQSIADLAKFTPNLEIVTAGATTATFFIRGVGLNDFNANGTGAVSIYQDDVALNSAALQLGTLFDMERVNVQRGPQGTGAFRNASAGAIKLYSKKPSGGYGGYVRGQYGRFDLIDLEGAVEAPIYEDILSSRFAFRYRDRRGFAKNGCGNAPLRSERDIHGPKQEFAGLGEARWREEVTAVGIDPDDPRLYHQAVDRATGEPLFENGVPVLTTVDLRPAKDPELSICGEYVPTILFTRIDGAGRTKKADGISEIPEGLPRDVNSQHNWAARGIFRFLPTLDMDWSLNLHGSRRAEQSRVGQSSGTGGSYCDPDLDIADCFGAERPAEINGLLGSQDSGRYQEPDTFEMFQDFEQQEIDDCGLACVRTSDRDPGDDPSIPFSVIALREAINLAEISTAESIAKNLDKRPYRGDYDRIGQTTNDTWGAALKGDLMLPGDIEFRTVSAFDTYDRFISIDLDFSPSVLFEIATADQGWQFFQDISFAAHPFEDLDLRVEAGGFYLMEELDVEANNDFGDAALFAVAHREYTQKTWSASAYVSAEWDFWEDFTLDGGFRYNYDRKEIDYALIRALGELTDAKIRSWEAPTGTVRLTYRFREDTHAYWKFSRGWKGGHYNATSSLTKGVTLAEPETINAFEVGTRGSWFDGRANLSLGFFYYDYENYQIFTAEDSFDGQPEFVILNVPEARMWGAEVDLRLRPLPGTFLNANFGWLETEFIDFVQIQLSRLTVGAQSLIIRKELQHSGNPLLNSPKFKVGLTAEQTLSLGRFGSFIARYDGAWTAESFFDASAGKGSKNNQLINFMPEGTTGQRAYWLHNVRLTYVDPTGTIELAAWARNLTNQIYKTFAFDGSTFRETTIYFTGDPRTYGVSLGVRF